METNMAERIVQAFATIKNRDTLVVIGRAAKPHSGVGLPEDAELAHALEDIKIGRRGKVKIVPRKLVNC